MLKIGFMKPNDKKIMAWNFALENYFHAIETEITFFTIYNLK